MAVKLVLAAIKAVAIKVATSKAIAYVALRAVLTNVALGAISKALQPGQDKANSSNYIPQNITVRGTVESRRLVLGERRVAGVLAFEGVSSSGNGTNDYYWAVVILASHQCQEISDVWLENIRIPWGSINATTGIVETGQFTGKVAIWKYLGTSQQTVDPNLAAAFPEWTSTHTLNGCCYIVVRQQKDDIAFPSGISQNISALVKGALVYDPRLDSTNGGSGTHRYSDASTWVYSSNPALLSRWYITSGSVWNDRFYLGTNRLLKRFGLGESNSRIDEPYWIAAANICDEQLSGANNPPGARKTRYSCNLEVSTEQTRRQILTNILATMGGMLVQVRGKWRIYAAAYDSPLHTLNQDDLYGDIEVHDTDTHTDRYNAVSAIYPDADQQWADQTTPLHTDSAYETQDGGERIPIKIDLRGVTDQYQAQRLAEIHLRRSRMQRKVVLRGAANLLKVALNETVLFSHARYGWTNRVFRVVKRQFEMPDGSLDEGASKVVLTCAREDAGVYTDLLTADYVTGDSATDVFQIDGPPTPLTLTATGIVGGISFAWSAISGAAQNLIYELFEHTASTPFSSARRVFSGAALTCVIDRSDTTVAYYWVRARATGNQVSGTTPASTGLAARAITNWEAGNVLNVNAWTLGVVTAAQGNFRSSESVVGESEIVLGGTATHPFGPYGATELLWKCQSIDATGLTADGGWDNWEDLLSIDPLRSYRSIVWFRYAGPASGSFYHGCEGSYTLNLDGSVNVNPYFAATGLSSLTANKWYASIGYIHGSSYLGGATGLSGIYDPETGAIVSAGTEFKMAVGAAYQRHRAYLYYCANPSTRLYFAKGMFEQLNGNEQSILSILNRASTGMIPAGAATEIFTSLVASMDVTTSVGVGDSKVVTSIAIPAQPFAWSAVATVTGIAEQNTGSVLTSSYVGINITSTPQTPDQKVIDTTGGGNFYQRVPFSVEQHFSAGAGLPLTFYVHALGYFPSGGGTTTVSNVRFKVEMIKR